MPSRIVLLMTLFVPVSICFGQVTVQPLGFSSTPGNRDPEADLAVVVGAARDGNGTVYVLDERRRRLIVFDSSGKFRYSAGAAGRGSERFAVPTAMSRYREGKR